MDPIIYLDYNASTPCDPRVVRAMLPYFSEHFANPTSRSHQPGRQAFMDLEDARQRVARCLGARRSSELSFCSGATEANNLALLGSTAAADPRRRRIVAQSTEHASVLRTLEQLRATGWQLTLVGVDSAGRVRLDELEGALGEDVALLSLMLANNETGVIQAVAEAVRLARVHGVVVHCDAAQAVGKIPVAVAELGIDLLTLSAHKLYGPKGVGALYRRHRCPAPRPQMHGGGQEGGQRSGTVNLPGVVGLATACELAAEAAAEEWPRLATLRDRLQQRLTAAVDGAVVNGDLAHRLPGTLSISLPDVDSESLMASVPELALSSGSACTSGRPEPSAVLRAMGVSRKLAAASIRLSVGRFTTTDEVERAADRIIDEATRLQGARRR